MTVPNKPRMATREPAQAQARTFDQIVSDLADFVRNNDRLPVTSGPTRTERTLARWVHRARSRRLTTAQIHAIDSAAPGWRNPTDKRREKHLDRTITELEQFTAEHGRLPKHAHGPERALRVRLQRQLAHATPQQRAIIDQLVHGCARAK